VGDRGLEILSLFEGRRVWLGDWRLAFLTARSSDEREESGAEARGEVASRQLEEVSDAVDPEAGECLGRSIIGVEQVDRQGGEKIELAPRWENPGLLVALSRRGRA
jgi:hypothetical protein